MGLRFENLRCPRTLEDVSPHHADQLVVLGVEYDGVRTSAKERIASLRSTELWSVGDRYEVWTHDVDCSSIFYAGSPVLVGGIVQFGFACHDYAAWLDLAAADMTACEGTSIATMDWSIDPDAGPSYFRLPAPPIESLPSEGALELGSTWPDVIAGIAPFDPSGALRNLVLGSSRERIEGLRALHGSPPIFRRDAIVRAIAVLDAMPRDAFLEELRAFLERTETLAVA